MRCIIPVEVKGPFFRSGSLLPVWFRALNSDHHAQTTSIILFTESSAAGPILMNKLCITKGLKIGHALYSRSFGFRLSSSVCS